MSKLRINENQHLGKQELNRLQYFLSEDGYKKIFKKVVKRFGIIREESDVNFDALRVVPGPDPGTVVVSPGMALDLNVNMITVPPGSNNDTVIIPSDSVTRKAIIRYAETSQEEGVVSVDALGNLTGTGTKFLTVLRGAPHHPVKIRIDQGANLQEYQVLSVISDTQAIIQGGSFTPESDKRYRVVGTFLPGVSVPSTSKFPFRYDFYQFSVVNFSYVLQPGEFQLALISYDGVDLTIQDSRYDSIFAVVSEDDVISTVTPSAQMIGIESVKADNTLSAKDYNVVRVGWGLRSNNSNWTADFPNNKIIISQANGGFHIDISTVVEDEFNGWRLYFENGRYVQVVDTQIISSQVHLTLLGYNPILHPISGKITVVPEADFIHLRFNRSTLGGDSFTNENCEITCPIKDAFTDFRVKAGQTDSLITYKLELRGTYSAENNMASNKQYLLPSSFDEFGNLVVATYGLTQTPSGMFDNSLLTDNFYNFKAWLNKDNDWSALTRNSFPGIVQFNGNLLLNPVQFVSFTTQPNGIITTMISGNHLELVCEVDSSINGIETVLLNSAGKLFVIRNSHSSTNNCTIIHDSAINPDFRILMPIRRNLVLRPGESATFTYDPNASAWVLISSNINSNIESWITVGDVGAPNFENGYTYFAANPLNLVQFRKDRNGMVHFRGALDGRTVSPTTGIIRAFTMPIGYRPSTNATGLLINQATTGEVISEDVTPVFVGSELNGGFQPKLQPSTPDSVKVWRLDGRISYFAAE